jgi:hypothetical protein
MADVFPFGCYAMSVEQAMDYDEKSGRRTPAKDKQTGELVWAVTVIDRDPEAREKQVKVKMSGPVQPVLPGEIAPGTGLHAVDFDGLTVTAYVSEGRGGGRARLAYSFRATGVYAQGKAPAGSAPIKPNMTSGRGSSLDRSWG